MTENDNLDVCCSGIEIDLFPDMREVDQMLTDFHGFVPGKRFRPATMIDVPAHGDDRCDGFQLIEQILSTDITGVQNP